MDKVKLRNWHMRWLSQSSSQVSNGQREDSTTIIALLDEIEAMEARHALGGQALQQLAHLQEELVLMKSQMYKLRDEVKAVYDRTLVNST